ncbi:MAG TPA: hypothetical protein VI911_10730 [Patescibacteria group bacterium]|nr:hypothetical protein [Patescibacteria group bacterium]
MKQVTVMIGVVILFAIAFMSFISITSNTPRRITSARTISQPIVLAKTPETTTNMQ